MRTTVIALGGMGLLPFLYASLVLLLGGSGIPGLPSWSEILITYAAIVASFLSGSHWGLVVKHPGDESPDEMKMSCKWFLIFTNMLAIISCLSLLVGDIASSLFILTGTFASQILADRILFNTNLISSHYFRFRLILTAVVLVCLVSVLIQILITG